MQCPVPRGSVYHHWNHIGSDMRDNSIFIKIHWRLYREMGDQLDIEIPTHEKHEK